LNRNQRIQAGALALALALCLPATSAFARQSPMNEPGREVLVSASTSAPKTPERVRRAVLQGASRYDWHVREDKPGHATLEYDKGSHRVVIDVDYDADGYQIKYRDSSDMNYEFENGRRLIHPAYNKWIENLGKAIREAGSR
jgi:hypothetical protein